MPKDKLTDYSATAASNTDVGGVGLGEGTMVPSDINNAFREQMSHLADFAAGTTGINVLNLQDDDNSASIKLQAPSAVTTTVTFTLPDGDGSANQFLVTDGSANLDWGSIATQAEAEAGTNNTNMMTPLRTAQAITEQSKGLIDYALFTSSSTYTVPAGTKKLIIRASGGGGGGANINPSGYSAQNGTNGGDTTVTETTLSISITAKGGRAGKAGENTSSTGGFVTGSTGGTVLDGGGSNGGQPGGHSGSIGSGHSGGSGSLVVAELDDPTEETISFTVGAGGSAGNTTYSTPGTGGFVEFLVFG